ncbi:phosphate/phosphite/phosphonate ABC transporter substrate-binding protein [Stutzerimonas nitrititolerans]|uniref:phosphate/phosphite/phosphonate ABC transporter substrate-binding protein n=1 Tax=Stutzerimonas nitrititolerans TaxID=2482751 RepID=UPI0028A23293|nr:phosphate/phosphite/phosphonate ABC transporter substrate-binding protein [Stutzerimonas nitrititolerans]
MYLIRKAIVMLFVLLFAAPLHAEGDTESLRIALIPKKGIEELISEYQPLIAYLSDELGMPVEVVPTRSYESVIDAIVSGGVDIAWLGPASYLIAKQRDPHIEPFARLTLEEGYFTAAGNHYRSILLVRRASGISRVSQLKGGRVALTDPASTSGSLIPNSEFAAAAGTRLERFFAAQVYAGSHDNALDALLEGRVDAAFVASVRADQYLQSQRMERDTLRVLWRSEPIHYDPFVFSGGLSPALKRRVSELMFANSPALAAFFDSQQATGLVAAGDADYERLRRYIAR